MARRHRGRKVDDSLSDESDVVFSDIEADPECETDLTSDGEDQQQDCSDLAELFADNEHPPEYYIQQLDNFDEMIYSQEDYSQGTTRLLDRVERQWHQYVAVWFFDLYGESD